MKKKLLIVLLFTAVLFLPKNTFAKTLEINYPSNEMRFVEMAQNYTIRESMFFNIGSPSPSGNQTIVNLSGEEIIGINKNGDKVSFYILPGITDAKLTSPITQEIRNYSIDYYGVDVFQDYDTIKMNVK